MKQINVKFLNILLLFCIFVAKNNKMKIIKPHNFILSKKFPDKYLDSYTSEEFPQSEINKHPRWHKLEYDNNGNVIYRQNFNGYWQKWEYNENKLLVYYENCNGYWAKYIYNESGKEIYYEDSDGVMEE